MSINSVLVIVVVAFLIFLGFTAFMMTNAETQRLKACVSSGGEWVDVNDGPVVNMGCKRSG